MINADQFQSQPQKKRLFFALWPDENVAEKIKQQAINHYSVCQGRFLDRHLWHITLAYFGVADIDKQSCLEQQADHIKCRPFELVLQTPGFWRQPKVAWLAPAQTPEALSVFVDHLQQAISPCGFKPEVRPYQPHITLVRKAKQAPLILETNAIIWMVDQFCLVESRAEEGGAQYHILKTWPFEPQRHPD